MMPKIRKEESMSAEECYFFCDDGINTHFGTQNSNECWCAVDPELHKNGPALDPDECSMLCAGTAVGEQCGGVYRMTVYEITALSRCQHETFGESLRSGSLPSPRDDQMLGQPWDFQDKFDTTKFFTPATDGSGLSFSDSSGRSCDVEDDHKKLLDQIDVYQHAERKTPRVFCGVYTHHPNHSTQVKAIKDTWASHCDGFVAFSDVDDPRIHSFKIKHEGPEEYGNMWQKSRAIWKYINFHYVEEFDWFVLGGDDVFIIVENLRKVARCLRKNGVEAFDTRDASGRERFHPFTPAAHLGYRKPEKVVEDEIVAGTLVAGWFVVQAIGFKFGRECCSRDSLSFHNVDEQLMRRLYHLLYFCPRDPVDWMATA
eukprot:g4198.t1